jgi:hypothetical protein
VLPPTRFSLWLSSLQHPLILRFFQAFLKQLRSVGSSLVVFVLAGSFKCLVSSGTRHWIPLVLIQDRFERGFLRIDLLAAG